MKHCTRCHSRNHTYANCPHGQALHAIKRARERYGVDLTFGDLRRIADIVQAGLSRFVRVDTNRVTEHIVEYRGASYHIAYDKHRKTVCSFLPMMKEG